MLKDVEQKPCDAQKGESCDERKALELAFIDHRCSGRCGVALCLYLFFHCMLFNYLRYMCLLGYSDLFDVYFSLVYQVGAFG